MSSQFSIGAERYRLFGTTPATAAAMQNTGLQALPTPSEGYGLEAKPWHPSSPMFAFGAVLALTVGLMAVSTSGSASVRVGKTVASVAGGAGVGSK
jgi:hypothetical protein